MSIISRADDALFLWRNGRLEGALLSALVAVAATARRTLPDKNITDRTSFERFLKTSHSVRISVEYQGACHPIEHILYKWLR